MMSPAICKHSDMRHLSILFLANSISFAWFSFFVHGFTFHFQTLHSKPSWIFWPVCPMCLASPKMLCALLSRRLKMRHAQQNHVNISWTC